MTVIYDEKFYQAQKEESLQSARLAIPVVLEMIGSKINSVADIGCGVGTWLSVYKEQGVDDVQGVDGDYVNRKMLLIDQAEFKGHDLTTRLKLDKKFDLVMSLEVAEHIDGKLAPLFCENLTSLADVILFSAAIPGQGGTHHVNEQWPGYWKNIFAQKGYVMVDALRNSLWGIEQLKSHYGQNSFIYVKESALANYPQLKVLYEQGEKFPLDAVHPKLFASRQCLTPENYSLSEILRSVPSFVIYAVKRLLKGQ